VGKNPLPGGLPYSDYDSKISYDQPNCRMFNVSKEIIIFNIRKSMNREEIRNWMEK
jgi:hypothetical protein